jgi:nucleoside-diphosphate-sugar epimerase
MIIGSGMVASALDDRYSVVFYAAGVSNSGCTDEREYARDRARLESNLDRKGIFVYFSTASDTDSAYVRHKREMEALVKSRGDYLICRCSQIAGKTSNPHTVLNYLYARISRSEGFDYWTKARRNIIDVADVREITHWLLMNGAINETVNIAAPNDYSVVEIISAFEQLTGKNAYARPVDKGDAQRIDTSRIDGAPVDFSGDYLGQVLRRYYA